MNPEQPDYRNAVDPNPEAVPVAEVAQPPGGSAAERSGAQRSGAHPGRIVGAVIAVLLLAGLVVFIVQNSNKVPITFLGFEGSMPLGVSMVIAAIAGMLIVGLLSLTIRIRRRRRRQD